VNGLRTFTRYWAALVFVGVLVQVGAAGYGAFYVSNKLQDKRDVLTHTKYDDAWNFHGIFGTFLVIAMIVLLLLSLAARVGKPAIRLPLALAVAGVVQFFLALAGTSVPAVGVLHPLNALVIFTLSGLLAHRSWRTARAATP
jgi:uncharacterized protein DUF6220